MKKEELKEMIISVADQSNVTRNNLVYVEIPTDEKEAETHWNLTLLSTEYKRGNKEGKSLIGKREYQIFSCSKELGYYNVILLRI